MKKPNEATPSKKKILIVDDHPLVRDGLRRIIDSEAGNAQEALVAVKKSQPDLVLIDLSLPGRDGIDLTKDLLARYPKLLVLMLSMHDESVYADRALRAGARGYVMKREPATVHLSAIRKVLSGEIAVSSSIVTQLTRSFNAKGSVSPMKLLSDRELEIFRLFGNGRTRCEIADNLHLSVKTIEAHRANIYKKLGLRCAPELLRFATCFVEDELRSPAA